MLKSFRRALRRVFGQAGGIKAENREQNRADAMGSYADSAPTNYVKAYDEGRPKH